MLSPAFHLQGGLLARVDRAGVADYDPSRQAMNPKIPASYEEVGRWLRGFAVSHAKRESPRIEATVETEGEREGKSYGLRLTLGALTIPPREAPPLEFSYEEVREGRTRFAWCEALARRLRAEARRLIERAPPETRSA